MYRCRDCGINRRLTDLVRAEQGPAEVPGLRRALGLGQPLLGHILTLHVRIEVKLVESLEELGQGNERRTMTIMQR